jgi:hypothetical protein
MAPCAADARRMSSALPDAAKPSPATCAAWRWRSRHDGGSARRRQARSRRRQSPPHRSGSERTGSLPTAIAIKGKRDEKSFPARVISRTPALSRRARMRKPSCSILCSQPGPSGSALAGDGRHGSMIPNPGRGICSRNDITAAAIEQRDGWCKTAAGVHSGLRWSDSRIKGSAISQGVRYSPPSIPSAARLPRKSRAGRCAALRPRTSAPQQSADGGRCK